MTNQLEGNYSKLLSIYSLEAVDRGRGVTVDGYMWTGTSPKDKDVVGVSVMSVSANSGIPVATSDGDRVVMESGGAINAGDVVYLDNQGRATTTSGTVEMGVSESTVSAAGEETLVILRIVQ